MQNAVRFTVKDAFALIADGMPPQRDATCERICVYPSCAAQPDARPENDTVYVAFGEAAMQADARNLYVPSLYLPDEQIEALIEYTLQRDARLLVSCAHTLEEAGTFDNRFGKSEVMALYDFGLLSHSSIVSGVYLDKDDLSLMAQESVSLTVLPTQDAGYGNGISPVAAAYARGVTMHIGTGDGAFNRTRNVLYEASVLRLLASAQMNKKDVVPTEVLAKMCLPVGADKTAQAQVLQKIRQM